MKSYLLCEKEATLLCMRLAGISGSIVKTPEETIDMIEELMTRKDIGIIMISENLTIQNRQYIMEKKLSQKDKLFIQVPEPEGVLHKDYITQEIGNSIGLKL